MSSSPNVLKYLPALVAGVIERHGPELKGIRPIKHNGGRFRDGLQFFEEMGCVALWYEEILPNGTYTSRIVRISLENQRISPALAS
jgi:hypothetical protein